ncbi:bifunctional adenosylcobinamide kinase/adenosylcobinamide-phosphate guanylyltransferase [Mycoplasmatota bacterium WC44]
MIVTYTLIVQNDRANDNWDTIEKNNDLSEIIDRLNSDDTVLIDCLTIWLSNEMFRDEIKLDVVDKMLDTIEKINSKVRNLVIVSNDIFSGVNNYDDLTRAYLSNLGDLHIKIVKMANEAYECISGLPVKRKGC